MARIFSIGAIIFRPELLQAFPSGGLDSAHPVHHQDRNWIITIIYSNGKMLKKEFRVTALLYGM